MKKTYTITLLCLIMLGTLTAQNRRIIFEDESKTWKEVKEKAERAGKYVFMNVSAVWCGPCRALERDVYSRDEVADFFNENFINVKFDMERGEGIAIRNQFSISAVPTLMWIDPKTGEAVHRIAGARDAAYLLEQAKLALDGDNTSMRDLRLQYEKTRSVGDLQAYLSALGRAGMSQHQSRVVLEHLKGFSKEQLMDTVYWNLVNRHIHDVFAEPIQQVFANRAQFSQALGAQRVDRKLTNTLQNSVSRLISRDTVPSADFDQERFNALLQFMKTLDDPSAPLHVLQLNAIGYAQQEDYVNMIKTLNGILTGNLLQGQQGDIFIIRHLTRLTRVTDKSVQNKGIALIDDIVASVETNQRKMSFLRVKSILLDRYGNTEGAEKTRQDIQAIVDQSGGRVMGTPMGG